MFAFLYLILLIAIVGYCAYKRVVFTVWSTFIGILLLALSYIHAFPIFLTSIFWLIFIGNVLIFGVTPIRHHLLTKPVLGFFRRTLPPISNTEKEAIEAGDVWWEGELFAGNPDWSKLLSIPKPILTEEEQNFLNTQVKHLCAMLDDWTIVQKYSDLPPEVWAYLKKEKFFGIAIPKEYGGRGFSALAHSSIITKIATRSCSAAVSTMVPNSLGPAELLIHYGTAEQKNYYLPRLANAEEIPCFALTGESAGSDAAAMTDYGIICKGTFNGEEVLGARLTWYKRYITLAPIATVLGLAVKLQDPDHLIGDKEDVGISVFLIPTSHPGVEIGRRHFPMNLAFMNGPTAGNDVFVPLSWLIGGESMVGQGWRMLMECLAIGRGISLPALSSANAQFCYRLTGIYARIRQQFKLSIGKFEGVGAALARIAGYGYLMNATRIFTAGAVDLKIKPAIASAIAKYHMTEILRITNDDAMDIHGGRGIQLGPRNYLGQAYESIPIGITVEGANILTRCLIIFGQGAIRAHPYIRKEMDAAANSDLVKGFQDFDKLLLGHIGFGVSNLIRTFWMGLTNAKWTSAPQNGQLKKYYAQLTRMSSALALTADLSMLILGGDLKRKENLSARLGDVLSHLYLASAVLKYYYDLHSQPDDLPYVAWCIHHNLSKIQEAFDDFFDNFPIRWLGKILRFITFPFGRSYHKPSDKLCAKLATHLMMPSALRDRLTSLVYLGEEKGVTDPIWRMENAFNLVLAADPIQQRIHNAVKNGTIAATLSQIDKIKTALNLDIITTEEYQLIEQAEAARADALKVDDFPFDVFLREKL